MEIFFLIMLIVLMAVTLAAGYPVAFALPGSAIVTILIAAAAGYIFAGDVEAYFSVGGPTEWLNAGITNFRGIYWEPERDTLIAIPLFIFMGLMLERSKIAADLLITMAQLFGTIPGGLGISVILVGALLAATTGILGATVIAMGLISLPVMMRNGYSNSLSTGIIASSGTLGQIIPPSIVLIILADQLSNATDQALNIRSANYKWTTGTSNLPTEFTLTSASAGDMFLGAILPGLVLVGLYVTYVLVSALIRPSIAPAWLTVAMPSRIEPKTAMISVKGGANPHTRTRWGTRRSVDRERAIAQWHSLRDTLTDLGVRVFVVPPPFLRNSETSTVIGVVPRSRTRPRSSSETPAGITR